MIFRKIASRPIGRRNDLGTPRHRRWAVSSALALFGSAGIVAGIGLAGQANASIGGTDVTTAQPWIVSVQAPNGKHFCTGSLIAHKWVLYAFHCTLASGDLQVRVGSLDHTQGGELVKVKKVHPHPTGTINHDTHTVSGIDLALLELEHPVSNTPIALAADPPAIGSTIRALGWGHVCEGEVCGTPEELRQIELPLSHTGGCADIDPAKRLCLNDAQKSSSAGDSGGPALTETADGWLLAGVTSGGIKRDTEYVSTYTQVAPNLEWIRSTAHIL